jgi:ERCC4-type nuclease
MLKLDLTPYVVNTHLLKTAVVLVDTREQENTHILDYFNSKKIPYKERKLDYGDYGLLLPKNDSYGIIHDMVLDFAVERKGSLDELSGNFTNDRDRIENELWRGCGKMIVVIENGSVDKILAHDYRTQYDPKSFLSTIATFHHRYNVPFYFADKKNSGAMIYAFLHYNLRECLK